VAPVKAVLEYKTYSRFDAAVPFREFLLNQRKSARPLKQRSSNPVDDFDERGITPFGDHKLFQRVGISRDE
jgi:hypothetical protein